MVDTYIQQRNLHATDYESRDMTRSERNQYMMEQVMESFMNCSNNEVNKVVGYLRVIADSSNPVSDTIWGEPKGWYTSGKFHSQYNSNKSYIMIDPEKWLRLHDAIGHGREGATESTVEWVSNKIESDEMNDIETPVLALSPSEYAEDPLQYEVEREGRSRGVGAKRSGLDKMPVLVTVRRPTR